MMLAVYGGRDVRARATAWAKAEGFQLLARRTFCQHVLLKRPCPRSRFGVRPLCWEAPHAVADHGRAWQRADGSRFLLAHVYASPIEALHAAQPFAAARGLTVVVDRSMDWYGAGSTPLRYELRDLATSV